MAEPADYFLRPLDPRHRRYEALRAIFVDEDDVPAVARRFGYKANSLRVLASRLRNGDLEPFPEGTGPGRPPQAHAEKLRQAVLALRRQNLDIIEISNELSKQDLEASAQTVYLILRDAGIPRLPRRTKKQREQVQPAPRLPPIVADVNELDLTNGRTMECRAPLVFLFAPLFASVGLDKIVEQAGLPGSRMLPSVTSLRGLLALKLIGRPRKNHATPLGEDPGLGLFAGLNVLPKATATHSYSYRVGPDMIKTLQREWVQAYGGKEPWQSDSFNLDFHAIRHYGEESELEKNYVPRRSQRVKSVLSVFAQEHESTTLVYAGANLLKKTHRDEVVHFVEYWEELTGRPPRELVFDSKGTTHAGLAELERRKVHFITLRERRAKEVQRLKDLPSSAWERITLNAPKRTYRHPRIVDERIKITGYPKKIRQIAAIDLGRPEPTLLLTNDLRRSPRTLLERYVKRAIIENSIGEQVTFFHLDALSSDVRLKVDLDIVLSVMASNCYHWLSQRLRGFGNLTAGSLWTQFLDRPGSIRVENDALVLRVRRFAKAPTLLESPILAEPEPIDWLGGRRLRLELT